MCTVAFVPLGEHGYLLGHNRDERRDRPRGVAPTVQVLSGRTFLAPLDPEGQGTWIGAHQDGLAICVLNASESDPQRLPPKPESRGAVLLEMMDLDDADAVGSHLARIERRLRAVRSFHVVVAEPPRASRAARSVRFRWDGRRLERDDHEGARLYVSSSLDPTGAEAARERSWKGLLRSAGESDPQRLRRWLASHDPERGPVSVCMHRPEAKTVSRTLVSVEPGRVEMAYLDGSPCTPDSDEITLHL
jgi:hypothetical protein